MVVRRGAGLFFMQATNSVALCKVRCSQKCGMSAREHGCGAQQKVQVHKVARGGIEHGRF